MDLYSSKLLNKAVDQFSILPGVGRRTALRLVLHLLRLGKSEARQFADSVIELAENVRYCTKCHNISDRELCSICSNSSRDQSVLCVVEDIRDVIAIENTQQYFGLYHVLGGVISPMDGVGPGDLNIEALIKRIENEGVKEVVMALGSTMEGDTTIFFIYKRIRDRNIRVTTISRGMAVGDQIEYTDEITLGNSIKNRVLYEQTPGR